MKQPLVRLHDDWRWIVRHAWSFRLTILAGLFTAAEAILPVFVDNFPRGLFAGLTLLAVIGGGIARVVAQRHGQ